MSEQNTADTAKSISGVATMAGLLLNETPRVGTAAQGAFQLVTERVATAGTGVRISDLHGVVKHRATLAAIGGGPVARGGRGIAGGLTRTAMTGGLATAAASALVIAGAIYLYSRQNSQN